MAEALHAHAPLVTVYSKADLKSEPSNTLLYGEEIEVLGDESDFLKIRSAHDGYEGYIESALAAPHFAKPHKVDVPVTHLYETPNFKTTPRHALYFGSPLSTLDARENGFIQLGNKGWVFEEHLAPIEQARSDFVDTALLFVNVPYLWGGRSVAGIDCSGLVQIALNAAGIPCPRDTSEQIETLGAAIDGPAQRGDLVFFKGHVGIMIDDKNILNATSRHMKTLIEPFEIMSKNYDGVLAIKRLG